MLYGQFLYGWSDYSTANLTIEQAVSLTVSSSQFSAVVEKVLQGSITVYPLSSLNSDVYRVRSGSLTIDGSSQVDASVSLMLDGSGVISGQSILLSDIVRLRQVDMLTQGQSGTTALGIKIMFNGLDINATSAFAGTGNFLSNVNATSDSISQISSLINVTYSSEFNSQCNSSILCNPELMYNIYTKDNETYTPAIKDNELYTVVTKDNEVYYG